MQFFYRGLENLRTTVDFRIQITLVLVFIFSRYWSKSIIRVPPGAPREIFNKF